MTEPKIIKLAELEESAVIAQLAIPVLGSNDFECVDHDNGNKSFELNNESSFIAIREDDFDKRHYARRAANFYSDFNPEFVLSLIHTLRKSIEVNRYYGDVEKMYDTALDCDGSSMAYVRGIDKYDAAENDLEKIKGMKTLHHGKRARDFLREVE